MQTLEEINDKIKELLKTLDYLKSERIDNSDMISEVHGKIDALKWIVGGDEL